MPSLKDHVETLKREKIAGLANAEADALTRVDDATIGDEAAARVIEEARERLAAIVAQPVTSLPDDDEALERRALKEKVAEYRVQKAEAARQQTARTRAEAEAALHEHATVAAPAFAAEIADLDAIVANFDARYPELTLGLFDLIRAACEAEAAVRAAKGGAPIAPPEFASGAPNSAILKIELLDEQGRVLWRGDQFTTAATDTHPHGESRTA